MRLRCVGGDNDGQTVDVLDPQHGMPVRVPIYGPMTYAPVRERVEPETIVLADYAVSCFRGGGDPPEFFLRRADWTDMEAMRFLLRRHGQAT